jgi:predicted nucleotidyltransferase
LGSDCAFQRENLALFRYPLREENAPVSPTIDQHRAELVDLCRRYRVVSLSLFGSAAREDFDPELSDYDFVVDFEALPPGQYADAYFGLLEALGQLLGRPVDLVVGSAIKNPYFRQSVEQTRALLYAA